MNFFRIWLNQHRCALGESLALYRHSYTMTAFSCVVMGIAASILFVVYAFYLGVAPYFAQLNVTPEINLFLKKEVTLTQIKGVNNQIALIAPLAKTTFIPKEESLAKLSNEVVVVEIQKVLGENPLPDSIRISLPLDSAKEVASIAAQLQTLPSVESVFYPGLVAQEIAFMVKAVRWGAIGFCGFLLFLMVMVSFNILRLTQVRHYARVKVSLWLGATPRFIRRIFYYQGLEMGLVVALWGSLCAWLALRVLNYFAQSLSLLTGHSVRLEAPPWQDWFYFYGLMVLFLWATSVVAARFFRISQMTRN